jgi:flagellar biosynthesis protein FlhG
VNDLHKPNSPKIWAIGGGKGGVGKSLVSILMATELAKLNRRTILIDADLGGANLHTMMGIKTPARTLNDYVTRKYRTMEEICIQTSVNHLLLICGASEILSFANPQYAQKHKIVQGLTQLPADHVILDLGAGTSYNVLDFFLIADYPIVVVTPQPISIQNAYGFIRNAVFRKLSRMAGQHEILNDLVRTAMDPKNNHQLHTLQDLFESVEQAYNAKVVRQLRHAIQSASPWVVTNKATDKRDHNAGRIVALVAEKYLTMRVENLGAIDYDPQIERMVSIMRPVCSLSPASAARKDTGRMVKCLINPLEASPVGP